MTGRFHLIPLVIASMLSLLRCTTQVVNTQTTTVRADTTDHRTEIDVESEPTLDRPVADFRAYRFTEVKDTRVRTTWLKYRPARAAWVDAAGSILAGGVVGGVLLALGRVVLGRDVMAVSAVPLAGIALASLGSFRRAATLIDTSRTTTPLPVVVACGSNQVATLYPDAYGTAGFELKDYLSSLPVITNDTLLTVSVANAHGPSRNLALTRDAYAGAVQAHRTDIEREEREERERRLAEERAQREERALATAAEIDTICTVYEGLYSGACLSTILVYDALGGASTTSDKVERLRIADAYVSQYKRAQSTLTSMHSPTHFERTYDALNGLAADLPRYVQACYELITTGDLFTVTSAEYRRLHARFFADEPGGFPVVTQFRIPFKRELLGVGLSEELVQELVNDLVLFNDWTVHNPLQSQPGTARDSCYPRILKELESRQVKSGE